MDEAAHRELRQAWAEEVVGYRLSAREARLRLVTLAVASTVLRIVLGRVVHGPFVFQDELGYERLAWGIARTGRLALFGKTGLSLSPLYPALVSPVYVWARSASAAYEWVKVVNAVLMSASVFPAYAIARVVLSRRQSLVAATLSALAPLMLYSALGLSENLAYPLFLVAAWALLRTLLAPTGRRDAWALVAIVLASVARLQLVVLFPVALTAIALVALLEPAGGEGRLRAAARALGRHGLLAGGSLALVALAAVRSLAQGRSLPLAGTYSGVGAARTSPHRVLDLALQHLAGLDLAVGVVPFAAALVAAYALARGGFPRRGLVLGAVAGSATVWLLAEVAVFSAAYTEPPAPIAPRINERYLIYLVPFFVVAFLAALRIPRRRAGLRAYLVAAAAAAALPAAIPFSRDINGQAVIDSFGLQLYARGVHGVARPIPHATTVAVAVAAALALVFVYAMLRRRPAAAVVVLACVLAFMSVLAGARLRSAAGHLTGISLPAQRDWVDRAVPGGSVALVGNGLSRRMAVWQTAFHNFTITRVFYTCSGSFGADYGEQRLTVDPEGRLRTASGPLRARYVVAPASFGLEGEVLARDAPGRLVLVAPAGGVATVPVARRSLVVCAR